MSGADVLVLIDRAPPFADMAEDPAATAEAVRKFGLAELDARLAPLRAVEGADRLPALVTTAAAIGQLVAGRHAKATPTVNCWPWSKSTS